YRQVEMTLLRGGGDRAQTVATQIANLLDQNLRQNRDDLRQTSGRPEVREFLERPDDPQSQNAVRTLLSTGPVNGVRRVEIWSEAGTRLLELVRAGPGVESKDVLPAATRPKQAGLSPLSVAGDVVFIEVVEDVFDEPSDQAHRLGFMVVR